jgi:hypothetical protein
MNPAKLLVCAPLTLAALALALDASGAPMQRKAERAPNVERPASTNATIARNAVRENPEAFSVCLHSTDATHPIWCTSIGALQRYAPDDSAKIDAAVSKAGGDWGAARTDLLTGADVRGQLAGVDLGCTGKGSSITLESSDLTGVLSTAATRGCTGATESSLGNGLAGLDAIQSDAWDMTVDYVDTLTACKKARRASGGRQLRPVRGSMGECAAASGCDGTGKADNVGIEKHKEPSVETKIGRAWEKIVDALGGGHEDPTANDGNGVRGYCFADEPCGAGSCEAEASAHALQQELHDDKTQSCDPAAMPNPEGSGACLTAKPASAWTKVDRQTAFTRVCELRQRVASDDGTARCVPPPPASGRDLDACHSNIGMCTPEQGGSVPHMGTRPTGSPGVPRARR